MIYYVLPWIVVGALVIAIVLGALYVSAKFKEKDSQIANQKVETGDVVRNVQDLAEYQAQQIAADKKNKEELDEIENSDNAVDAFDTAVHKLNDKLHNS